MASLLFRIFPAISHHNATFQIAAGLRARGHHVAYAATREMGATIEAQGFEFVPLESDFFPAPHPRDAVVQAVRRGWRHQLRDWGLRRRQVGHMANLFRRATFFDALLARTGADALLVDSPYVLFALSLLGRPVRAGIIESMVNLAYAPNCPPLNSARVPRPDLRSRLAVWLDWQWQRAAGGGRSLLHLDMKRPGRVLEHALRRAGRGPEAIDTRRYFHIGIRELPEFILSPREFDFPRPVSPSQHYVGPSVNLDRREVGYDYRFDGLFEAILARRAAGRPLVYCAFGTMSFRYAGVQQFLRHLLAAAADARWQLVLALGEEIDARALGPQPENVTVFQRVPQLRVLRQADLMITHGGMNSIAEALLLEVPMIVVPGDNKIDQTGNAARVVYHRIGCRLSMQRSAAPEIRRTVEAVLADGAGRARVARLAAAIRGSEAFRDGAAIVERVLLGEAAHA